MYVKKTAEAVGEGRGGIGSLPPQCIVVLTEQHRIIYGSKNF
jgi:hypothetical protein